MRLFDNKIMYNLILYSIALIFGVILYDAIGRCFYFIIFPVALVLTFVLYAYRKAHMQKSNGKFV
jgi:hypothetical protein